MHRRILDRREEYGESRVAVVYQSELKVRWRPRCRSRLLLLQELDFVGLSGDYQGIVLCLLRVAWSLSEIMVIDVSRGYHSE